ncbi:Late Golgi vesicles protein [Actinomortierella ambigua]|nr:Late Golgi vesicles protein [Actinomortierella ambigua]
MAFSASLFRLLNIIVAVLIILGGVLLFVDRPSWSNGIVGFFMVVFGVLTFLLEFVIPETLVYNLGFMFSLIGRGFFYIVIGLLCLSWKWFNILVGCFIMAAGLFYIAMHFVGATPSPSMSAVPNTSITNLASSNATPSYGTAGVDTTQPTTQPTMVETYQSPNPNAYQSPNPNTYQSPNPNVYQGTNPNAANQV